MSPSTAAFEAVLPQHAQLCRFDAEVPRCAAYPSSTRFVEAVCAEDVSHALRTKGQGRTAGSRGPMAIRVDVPFSERPRAGCASGQVVTRRHGCASRYLRGLVDEVRLAARALGSRPVVAGLHVGGADPLFLDDGLLERLVGRLHEDFRINLDADLSFEASPERCTPARIGRLRAAGFNRLTLTLGHGACRGEGEADLRALVGAARHAGYARVSVRIACGLLDGAADGAGARVRQVVAERPHGIRLVRDLGVPRRGGATLAVSCEGLQPMLQRTGELLDVYECLLSAGYVHVGLDEFALPGDAIATACRQGRLQPGIDGFSARPEGDVLAFGASAVGRSGNIWYRNVDGLGPYYATLADGRLPVARGLALGRDDLARRAVIVALVCQGRVDFESISLSHLIDMRAYFARELAMMQPLAQAGLVDVDQECLELTALGRWFAPVVAGLFDRELQRDMQRRRQPVAD